MQKSHRIEFGVVVCILLSEIGYAIFRRNRDLHKKNSRMLPVSPYLFLGHIERDTRKLSVDTLYKIAKVLHCSADELLGIDAMSDSSAVSDEISSIIAELQALKRRFN